MADTRETGSQPTAPVPEGVRQAVVIVHGMGEQRPLDMLNGFIDAALPIQGVVIGDEEPRFYSRPDEVADSYESRRLLAPGRLYEDGTEAYAQTEFFEYHWAHEMQGNKFSDLFTTLRRMLLQRPSRVPSGLLGIWWISWLFIIGVVVALYAIGFDFTDAGVAPVVVALLGGGVAASLVSWVLTNFLPGKISSTFVDVVRYLDTSPRSYAVRKAIRRGMVDLLHGLHETGRYQRIVVVAHSLGAYIAYDGISFLWTLMNQEHCAAAKGEMDPEVRRMLESAAEALLNETSDDPSTFRDLQRDLWLEYRRQGNPWLITDFVTVGTPMYMADQLMTNDETDFSAKVDRRQIDTCPPRRDLPSLSADRTFYSYPYKGGPVLYHAAPFAVTRWTNLWFPAHWGFFGDWFGGALRPLFGSGIKDVAVQGNTPKSRLPAAPHTMYFSFPEDESAGSLTKELHDAMGLDSTSWLAQALAFTPCPKKPDATDPLTEVVDSVRLFLRQALGLPFASRQEVWGD